MIVMDIIKKVFVRLWFDYIQWILFFTYIVGARQLHIIWYSRNKQQKHATRAQQIAVMWFEYFGNLIWIRRVNYISVFNKPNNQLIVYYKQNKKFYENEFILNCIGLVFKVWFVLWQITIKETKGYSENYSYFGVFANREL